MQLYSYCNIVGKTDVGCKRSANEDWLDNFECRNGLVAVVCDGMGGHVGGEIASHLAVETIRNFLENNYFDDPRQAIIEACNEANEAIIRRTQEKPELTGMGATCVMLIVRDGKVYYGSVGDSRIYLVRSKRITQLTVDQSYVQMLVDMGEITKEQAEHHPRKNEITNALGLDSMKPATVAQTPVNPEAGDCFILCSDGLSGMVSDETILKIAGNQQKLSQKERVDSLIAMARKNGGLDNITCQIVEFSVTPSEIKTQDVVKKKLGIYVAIAAAVVAVAVCAVVFLTKKGESPVSTPSIQQYADKSHVETYPDTISYMQNEPVMVLKENPDYNSVEINIYDNGVDVDKYIIKQDVHLGDIKFSPEREVVAQLRDGSMTVMMNSRSDAGAILLRFMCGDSAYVYLFPIKYADRSTLPINISAPPSANKKSTGLTDVIGSIIKNSDEVPATPVEDTGNEKAVVSVSDIGTTIIKLTSAPGDNTATELFTEYAIDKLDQDNGWNRLKCDDRMHAVITIDNAAVPRQNALITVPLFNTDKVYLIYVKKQS